MIEIPDSIYCPLPDVQRKQRYKAKHKGAQKKGIHAQLHWFSFHEDAVHGKGDRCQQHQKIAEDKPDMQQRGKRSVADEQEHACYGNNDACSLFQGNHFPIKDLREDEDENGRGDGNQRKIDRCCGVPGDVNQGVKNSDPYQSRCEKVAEVVLYYRPLTDKAADAEWHENSNSDKPSPEGKADWRDAFAETARDNIIAGPDDGCADRQEISCNVRRIRFILGWHFY